MRITEDRYRRDHVRHDLALRMIRHEARTCTIRACTGLSDDRIRKLYRFYVQSRHEPALEAQAIRRRRGRSPRQITVFTRNIPVQIEASLLAGLFHSFGMLANTGGDPGQQSQPLLGSLFCDAYDIYSGLRASESKLSFEHGWLLWRGLACDAELFLDSCPRCRSLFVRQREPVHRPSCPLCRLKRASHRRAACAASRPPRHQASDPERDA
jgi:hypothetical protein